MPEMSVLKSIALKAGLSKDEIYELYSQAIEEAKYLGKEGDISFVLEIVQTLAGLDEEDINKTISKLNTKFLESDYTDFNQYLEDNWEKDFKENDGLVSTDFPPDVRPEHKLGHSVKFPPDETEEEDKEDEKI